MIRNPIHKRLEQFESWQHLCFMLCLCERMYPNFQLFCQIIEKPEQARIYQNQLNLVWEFLTVKDAKINFENQLEKLEAIIPDINDYDFFGVLPAADACESLSELLHSIIAGDYLAHSIQISKISLKTVASFLEAQMEIELSEQQLKNSEQIQQELDVQWLLYRELKNYQERDLELILGMKKELRDEKTSNIGLNSEL